MPIYCYSCPDCSLEFEELRSFEKKDEPITCPDCGATSKRLEVTGFSFNSGPMDPKRETLVSPKEIDKAVGAATENYWKGYNEKWKPQYDAARKKRWAGRTPQVLNIPKDPDGKYTPLLHLGDKKERAIRKEFADALKDHRDDRKKKGLSQFGDNSMAADRDRIILKNKGK